MASKINADEFVDREGEGKPTLPKGVVLSGVTTITTAVVAENEVANSTGINVGIITSTHFAGNLTGDVNAGIVTVTSQSVIGSAVTISASGIDIGAGVITATSYAGDGSALTGIGATIMIWEYNPDPSTHVLSHDTGIGITFNQEIKAGSGNITIRETSASGTVVENFGIGSSVTIAGNSLEFTPSSALGGRKVYHISLPSGVITNMAGDSYVGTAYTFSTAAGTPQLFAWGGNEHDNNIGMGILGLNDTNDRSSPTQIPGTTWSRMAQGSTHGSNNQSYGGIKDDGTLWTWGDNNGGQLGTNQAESLRVSSPTQVPGTTWASYDTGMENAGAVRTDGTLWTMGQNTQGQLGQNDTTRRSSPVQVGSDTTWSSVDGKLQVGRSCYFCVKTDGTLWAWGGNGQGYLGQNNRSQYSSPVQIPGTTWNSVAMAEVHNYMLASKTDGTLWTLGDNQTGNLGQNSTVQYSSPVQIPGTDWRGGRGQFATTGSSSAATKTDGTLWTWGNNQFGILGQSDQVARSSPTQVPGTTWKGLAGGDYHMIANKTDGTLWAWGTNNYDGGGQLGQNNTTPSDSPVQIGTETMWTSDQLGGSSKGAFAIMENTSV